MSELDSTWPIVVYMRACKAFRSCTACIHGDPGTQSHLFVVSHNISVYRLERIHVLIDVR